MLIEIFRFFSLSVISGCNTLLIGMMIIVFCPHNDTKLMVVTYLNLNLCSHWVMTSEVDATAFVSNDATSPANCDLYCKALSR